LQDFVIIAGSGFVWWKSKPSGRVVASDGRYKVLVRRKRACVNAVSSVVEAISVGVPP